MSEMMTTESQKMESSGLLVIASLLWCPFWSWVCSRSSGDRSRPIYCGLAQRRRCPLRLPHISPDGSGRDSSAYLGYESRRLRAQELYPDGHLPVYEIIVLHHEYTKSNVPRTSFLSCIQEKIIHICYDNYCSH